MDLTSRMCNDSIENCMLTLNVEEVEAPIDSTDYYIFGFMSLFNAVVPLIYFNVSTDVGGKFYEKNPKEFPMNKLEASHPLLSDAGDLLPADLTEFTPAERATKSLKDQDTKTKRKRGEKDDKIWATLGFTHAGVWGTSTLLWTLSMFGILNEIYALYIEYGIANLNWIVYLGGLIALSIDAGIAGDAQGFLEMAFYAIVFTGGAWIIEMFFGTGAIKYLDVDYPYYDSLLLPTWMYLFIEHEEPLLDYENVENDMEPYAKEGEDYSETDGELVDIEKALDDEVDGELENEIEEEIKEDDEEDKTEEIEEEEVKEEDDFAFDEGEESEGFDFDFE